MNENLKNGLIGLIIAVVGGGFCILLAYLDHIGYHNVFLTILGILAIAVFAFGILKILINCFAALLNLNIKKDNKKSNSDTEMARKASPLFTYEEAESYLSYLSLGDKIKRKMSFISTVHYRSNSLLQVNRCFFTVEDIYVVSRVFLYDIHNYGNIENDGKVFTEINEISKAFASYKYVHLSENSKTSDSISGLYINEEHFICLNTITDTEFSTASEIVDACKSFADNKF